MTIIKETSTKWKHPDQFGGKVRPFRNYWHDGVQYEHCARFDSDEQIDAWIDASSGIAKSARTITADGYLTVYWS